jgi:hypothetical protein
MSTTADIIIAVLAFVAVAALVLVGVFVSQNLQHKRLHDRFGPEYERTVQAKGDRKEAELDLRDRARRRKSLKLRDLNPEERAHYQQEWRTVQANFVDSPITALGRADALMTNMMLAIGYPMQDFDEQADLVSVDHPTVVENYRRAHGTYVACESGPVPTEELRPAFISYRLLFSELVEAHNTSSTTDTPTEASHGSPASPATSRSARSLQL